jgi:hypothetical protein
MTKFKNGFIATITLLTLTTAANSTLQLPEDGNILNSKVQVGQVANAGYSEAGKWLTENKDWVISNVWSWWTIQVYMAELSPIEVNQIKIQFRDRAGIELFNVAQNRAFNLYNISNYDKFLYRTTCRYFWHGRIENGKYNIYLSMPRNGAQDFKNRRGF